MIKSTLLTLLFTSWYAGIVAQEARPVTIAGQVQSDKDSVKLVVWFSKDPLLGYGDEMEKITVPISTDGKFSFSTPPITEPARLSMHDGVTGNALFTQDQQLIAPGDQLQVFGNIHDQGDPYYFKAVFLGDGAAKYECVQALKMVDMRALQSSRGTPAILHAYDSLLKVKQTAITNFEKRLSNNEAAVMRADVTGELRGAVLAKLIGYTFGSVHAVTKPTAEQLAEKKKIFDSVMNHFGATAADDAATPLSTTYRKYLYQKAKAELVFENAGGLVKYSQLFKKLSKEFTGLLRDKLVSTLLLDNTENYYFFGGTDADEHRKCLQEAVAIVQAPDLKKKLQQHVSGLTKGAPAFNFNLPVDSSDTKKLSLADLKGKVVLLDLWTDRCTGCMKFSQAFHKKIYPSFQNNPEFVVVSIMLGEIGKDTYMRRLRSDGGQIYTFKDYTNLFGGKGIASARDMEAYHNINAFPTILLLDKHGKMFSSTLPVIYGDSKNKDLDKNVDSLTELIKKALAAPGPKKPHL